MLTPEGIFMSPCLFVLSHYPDSAEMAPDWLEIV